MLQTFQKAFSEELKFTFRKVFPGNPDQGPKVAITELVCFLESLQLNMLVGGHGP